MKLSPLQTRVYGALSLNKDTRILDVYKIAYPKARFDDIEVRVMQQRLGSAIARINEKLEGKRIVPGRVKQTYRLEKIKKEG